jgi:hypothetical protein
MGEQTNQVGEYRGQVLWSKSFKKEVCIDIWSIGKKCASVKASISIVLEGAAVFTELELLGHRKRFALVAACYDMNYGIGKLEICLENVEFKNNLPILFGMKAKLCLEKKIFGHKIDKCWNVYRGQISLIKRTEMKEIKQLEEIESWFDDSDTEIMAISWKDKQPESIHEEYESCL